MDNEVKNKKVKKYQRDKKDYMEGRVYKWQEDEIITNSANTSLDKEGETRGVEAGGMSNRTVSTPVLSATNRSKKCQNPLQVLAPSKRGVLLD